MPGNTDGFGNTLPRRRIGEVTNNLPIDLYRWLLPRIRDEDQASGSHGYSFRWDDPNSYWDSGDPLKGWDAVGLAPVIQELFYVLEKMEGEEIAALESLDALVDPLRCPEELLPQIAASFGYALQQDLKQEEGLNDIAKRTALLGLIDAYRARGTWVGWKVFYRLIGVDVINVRELYKANVNEAGNDYSRVRYETATASGVFIGPAGSASFAGTIPETPIKPGTVRIAADTGSGVFLLRDDPIDDVHGTLIGPGSERGTIDYRTGDYTLVLQAPATAMVTASLEKVTKEWPYHAARIDLEILLSPGGSPIPRVDIKDLNNILLRMEETRPIHVLLRSLALIAEIRDTFGEDGASGASDRTGCLQRFEDVRTGQPFPGTPGRNFQHVIDLGSDAADEMTVEKLDPAGSGARIELDQVLEEQAPLVCPLDSLIINTGGPDQYY